MCEANAYLVRDGQEELIMESVDLIEPEGEDGWRVVAYSEIRRSSRERSSP